MIKNFLFSLMLAGSVAMLIRAVFFDGDPAVFVGGLFMGCLVAAVGNELEQRRLAEANKRSLISLLASAKESNEESK